MRTQIATALKRRCTAIRTAVTAYNKAADALEPKRPHVKWEQVSKLTFIEEFALLRDTRNDIRGKGWTDPTNRELIKSWNRIKRAREEVIRCQIETRRIHTAIVDEHKLFDHVLSETDPTDPLLVALEAFFQRRRSLDAHILRRIYQIYALPWWTGPKGPGVRLGSKRSTETEGSVTSTPLHSGPGTAAESTPAGHELGSSDHADNAMLGAPNALDTPLDDPIPIINDEESGDEWEDEELQGQMDILSDWTGRLHIGGR